VLPGTNGFVVVEFQAADGPHLGWIRYNRYGVFRGVAGSFAIVDPYLDFLDFGYQAVPGAPLVVGAESSLPLTLSILRTDAEVRLTWHPLRSRAILETTPSLTDPNWGFAQSPGVTSYTVTADPNTPGMFFRLRPPEVFPPVVFPW
jgi:hypothetical protein